jgi:hypothetical protein
MTMTIQDAYDVLADTKTILLSTRKRDGSWVPTPVTVAVEPTGPSQGSARRAYFRTYDPGR